MQWKQYFGCLALLALSASASSQPQLSLPSAKDAVTAAYNDCLTMPKLDRPYIRYLSLYNIPEKDREKWRQTVSFIVNSLSRTQVIKSPAQVGNLLLRIDLRDYDIPRTAWDNLGEKGSGRTPVPEPYFHKVVEVQRERIEERKEYWPGGHWNGRYYEPGYYITKTKVPVSQREIQAIGGWLPKQEALSMVTMTESQHFIFRADWFCYYATLEPAYHLFLGLGDEEDDFRKLGAADEKTADAEGAQARGAVLFSEPAPNNRILERTPTIRIYGRGWYAKSFDFSGSVRIEDVLKDADAALTDKSDAHEIITSLKNGLQAYFISNNKGKRLDRTDAGIARDVKNGFSYVEIEIRNCMVCHQRGMIAIDDEVRAVSKDKLAAAAALYSKKDEKQARRFLEKYAAAPLDELLKFDSQQFESAVKAANGLTGTVNGQQLLKFLLAYEAPVTVDTMAREVGLSPEDLRKMAPTIVNPDHSIAIAVGANRKVRRDQWESTAHSQLAEAIQASRGGSK